eukprot:TRINITY_DN5426_c0_g1_i1.p1 TRINITY_DN5426_c0_g1~~TRINITY_DN5426_c0_g1_i1.p1  ORF type:complete len:391 (+),score=50.20 TRINITY_DN5426_c0_g1_i1:310-1482(+)
MKTSSVRVWTEKDTIEKISSTPEGVLIIDGLTNDESSTTMIAHATFWERDHPSRRTIFVTSNALSVADDEMNSYEEEVIPNGWEIEEYFEACKDQQFFLQVEKNLDADQTATNLEEKIRGKFFIAGASARWMFSKSTEEAVVDIRKHIPRTPNINDLTNSWIGDRSQLAVNHLNTIVNGVNILVSQFVARELAKRIHSGFISRATEYAPKSGNGSLNGWIFQMDFLHHLRMAGQAGGLELFDKHKKSIQWNVLPHVKEFYKETDLDSQCDDDTWLIPTKINQGCYDALQICTQRVPYRRGPDRLEKTLRVVQLTVAKTHTLKLRYVITILDQLKNIGMEIQNLEVVIVVPYGQQKGFQIGEVTGHDDEWFTELQWKANHIKILGFKRTGP